MKIYETLEKRAESARNSAWILVTIIVATVLFMVFYYGSSRHLSLSESEVRAEAVRLRAEGEAALLKAEGEAKLLRAEVEAEAAAAAAAEAKALRAKAEVLGAEAEAEVEDDAVKSEALRAKAEALKAQAEDLKIEVLKAKAEADAEAKAESEVEIDLLRAESKAEVEFIRARAKADADVLMAEAAADALREKAAADALRVISNNQPLSQKIQEMRLELEIKKAEIQKSSEDTKRTTSIITEFITKIGVVIIALYMVQILLSLARYQFRLADHLEIVAVAIKHSGSDIEKIAQFIAAVGTNHIDFGKVPTTSIDKLVKIIKELSNKIATTKRGE